MPLNINIIDGSNYFKGLLLLIRKDRQVTESEIQLMRRIGKSLGFEREFCDQAIRDILDNEYIEDTPPKFSSTALAEKFVKDGLAIACSDQVCHPAEETWLRTVCILNGLDEQWFRATKAQMLVQHFEHQDPVIEAEDIVVQYTAAPDRSRP